MAKDRGDFGLALANQHRKHENRKYMKDKFPQIAHFSQYVYNIHIHIRSWIYDASFFVSLNTGLIEVG